MDSVKDTQEPSLAVLCVHGSDGHWGPRGDGTTQVTGHLSWKCVAFPCSGDKPGQDPGGPQHLLGTEEVGHVPGAGA